MKSPSYTNNWQKILDLRSVGVIMILFLNNGLSRLRNSRSSWNYGDTADFFPKSSQHQPPMSLDSFVYHIVWTLYENEYFTVCTVLFYRKHIRASTTQSPEQQPDFVAFTCSRIFTASHFSSMVIITAV